MPRGRSRQGSDLTGGASDGDGNARADGDLDVFAS